MGYSARYHAASLAAVFLALAIGILIGVGFGSDVVSGTAEDLERSLGSDLDEAREEVDALDAELEREREFAAAVYPELVEGRLRGERIALIGLGGLSGEVVSDVEAAVGPAGAAVTEIAQVRLPPDLEALSSTLSGSRAREVARGGKEALDALGRRAARLLLEGGRGFDSLRRALLSRFSGSPGRIDAVVVVRSRPDDLDAEGEAITNSIEDGVMAGIVDRGLPVVGVERSTDERSEVEFFESRGIPSVDSVDLTSGRLALVHALRGGVIGSFGIKESADSLLPEAASGG